MRWHKLSASVFGLGYLKGGGTWAAMATCLAWYGLQDGKTGLFFIQAAVAIAVTAIGIWNGNRVEKEWGKDSSRVVIDEVAGQCVSLLFVSVSWQRVLTGLVLFRLFDIMKPLGIRKMEYFKGGWGVMADDVLAGTYTCLLLHGMMYEHWI